MHRLFSIVTLLFLFTCNSPNNSSSTPSKSTTISGMVNIPGATKAVLKSNNSQRLNLPLTNGQFQTTIDDMEANHYLLMLGGLRTQLYTEPGAQISINGSPGNILFLGDLAAENTYLNEKAYIRDTMPADRLLLDYTPEAFKNRVNITQKILQTHLQNFPNANQFSKTFTEYAEAMIDYEIRQLWQDYIVKNLSQIKQIEAKIGQDYKNFAVNLDQPRLIMNPVFYKNLWRNFQQIQLLSGIETNNEIETAKYRMNYLDNNTAPDSEIRSILYFTTFNQLLNFYRGTQLTGVMDKFNANCKDTTSIAKITKRYEEVKHLMAGQMAPDFTLPDIDGKMISLSQFRGKVVAIDLWATWCEPCIDAFSEWEALQQAFTNDEVIFLTISIDEKKDQWSNFVHDNNKKGYQLYAENTGVISFKQAYFVRRIPRYMLIDQTGKIIDTDRSKLTKEDIEDLLASQ